MNVPPDVLSPIDYCPCRLLISGPPTGSCIPNVFDVFGRGLARSVADHPRAQRVKWKREDPIVCTSILALWRKQEVFPLCAQMILGNCWRHLEDTGQTPHARDF